MLSHFDIENTDLSQYDHLDGERTCQHQHVGKEQISSDSDQTASDSQEPVILRTVSFPEWIIGRWSSAFNSISSSKDHQDSSDTIAHNENTALLSHNDETSCGTSKTHKNITPVISVAANKHTHPSSDRPNSNSAITVDLGDRDRAIVPMQQQQPKKDLQQYESFKDLTPRVSRYRLTHSSIAIVISSSIERTHLSYPPYYLYSMQKPAAKRRGSWGMFSVLRYSSSSAGRLSSSSISPDNLVVEMGSSTEANKKRRFYSYDDMSQVDPVRSSDDRPASPSLRNRSQSFSSHQQQTNKPFTIHELEPCPDLNATKSPSDSNKSHAGELDLELDNYSDNMSECSSCDGSDSSSDEEWDSLFPDEQIKAEYTNKSQLWHMKAYRKSRSVLGSIRALLSIKTYRYLLGVNTALYFTVTGVQFWGTKYLTVALNAPLPLVNALFILCAATVSSFTGLLMVELRLIDAVRCYCRDQLWVCFSADGSWIFPAAIEELTSGWWHWSCAPSSVVSHVSSPCQSPSSTTSSPSWPCCGSCYSSAAPCCLRALG